MLKKTIVYKDYNDNELKKTFYFNLSKAEVAEMEQTSKGGLVHMVERLIEENDGEKIVAIFKKLILQSYGVKSDDGERFIKTQELRDAFSQTDAYSELYMELSTNATAAEEFIKGILPKDLVKDL
jgi:hypothetical protein